MRLLAGSLVTTAAIFASSRACGQQVGQSPGGQASPSPAAQSSQAIKGQPAPQAGQNPIGQAGQNPIGQTNQGIKGQPGQQSGQNPIGQSGAQRGQNVVGQPGQNPLGQPVPNMVGQPGQNPLGQPSPNLVGQPGQNSLGQPGQNAIGQSGQLGPTQFGQIALGTQTHFGTPLYQIADIRRSLNVTDDQIGRMNTASLQLQQRFVDQSSRLRSLSDAERSAVLQKLQSDHQQEFIRSANGVFTPEQMRRYQQLEYQYQGPGVFSNPDIRNRFNLTNDQVQRLQDLHDQNTRWLQMFQEPGGSGQDAAARYSTHRQELNEKTNAILNPEQRRAWQEMTGDPYDFRLNDLGTTTVNNQQP